MKKSILIGLVLVVVLIGGVLIGLSFNDGNGEPSGEITERIDVPGGNGIKIISRLPAELEIIWEEIEVTNTLQLELGGRVKNISEYSVDYKLLFLLDGQEFDKWPHSGLSVSLNPGEEDEFRAPRKVTNYWDIQNAKTLEIKVEDYQKKVILSDQTEKTTAEPVKEVIEERSVFTSAPKNPKGPDEIVAAFYFLASEGKYAQASKYAAELTPEVLERDAGQFFLGRKIEKIELEYKIKENGQEGYCEATLYFTDGTNDYASLSLAKESDGWKFH